MMKLAIISLFFAGAAAFAPSKVQPTNSALFAYENELGVIKPTGFFDPAGFTKDLDPEKFDFYRTAELKHGRVCMLGVIGYIVPEIFRFPGEIAPGLAFSDIPNGVAAIDTISGLGWAQMVFFIGAVDYNGFLGSFPRGQVENTGYELNELQHGRLAMLAMMELLRHDSQNFVSPGFDGLDNLITGLPFLYN